MNLLMDRVSSFWSHVNGSLFPALEQADVEMTPKLYKFVALLDFLQIELFVPTHSAYQVGAKPHDRRYLARAFVAKAFYNAPDTKSFRDRLLHDKDLRKVCGWDSRGEVPSESTFSRAFALFADIGLNDVATDSTAIHAREKPVTRAKPKADIEPADVSAIKTNRSDRETDTPPLVNIVSHTVSQAKLVAESMPSGALSIETNSSNTPPSGSAPMGEEHQKKTKNTSKKISKKTAKNKSLEKLYSPADMSRLERQIDQVPEIALLELGTACDVGCKTNSQGNKDYWVGYKLNARVAAGCLPLIAVTTSASVHDSQVSIPLMKMCDRLVTSLYELEDRAYDAHWNRKAMELAGHVPIIDYIKRRGQERARELDPDRAEHYKGRTVVERFNARLKDEFGGETVRVRGNRKVHAHLMFGVLLIFADQLLRLFN
jgi:hypothetical protein